jgi:DinB superfamily
MAGQKVAELRTQSDAAWANLRGQLDGMEPHLDRAEAPGEWTTRQVLSHLLFEPGSNAVDFLAMFVERDYPTVNFQPGQVHVTPERERMTLRQFGDALDAQRHGILAYLDSLPEADLDRRKVRIPLFKQFVGTDEISLAMFAGGMFNYHWTDHAGQLARIRKAAGLPEATR